jgi:cytochrome P450
LIPAVSCRARRLTAAYLPFGTGPRVCIGAQFALTEATLVWLGWCGNSRSPADDRRSPVARSLRPDLPPPFRLRPR